jgi:hypothetical protein
MKKATKLALISVGAEPTKAGFASLSGEQLTHFHELMQTSRGMKIEDNFSIRGIDDKELLKYNSIKDWDYSMWHNQQEITGLKDEYKDLYVMGTYFKAIEQSSNGEKELIYGYLSSVLSYVSTSVFEALEAKLDKKYPFIYVQKYGSTDVHDNEKRVCGKEKERAAAETALNKMWADILMITKIRTLDLVDYTFRKRIEKDGDVLDLFLLGGIPAAEESSFKTFFRDFSEKQQPFAVLDNIVEDIVAKFSKKI